MAGVAEPLSNSFIDPQQNSIVIETPADIEQLRKTDRVQSDAWRSRQREAFQSAQRAGLRVIGLTNNFSYVLAESDEKNETNGAL